MDYEHSTIIIQNFTNLILSRKRRSLLMLFSAVSLHFSESVDAVSVTPSMPLELLS